MSTETCGSTPVPVAVAPLLPKPKKPDKSPVLVAIYRFTTLLCIFIVLWILFLPGSAIYPYSAWHQRTVPLIFFQPHSVTPPDIITKYQQAPLVQALHIVPGAVWAILVPPQMHSQVRKYYRFGHKVGGYMLAVAAMLIGIGAGWIIHQGLFHENFFPDLEPLSYSGAPGILLLAIYFVGSMTCSIYMAAVRGDYHLHRKWMVRHIASGIWISLQRILLSTLFNWPPFTRDQQRDIFPRVGILAIIITLSIGEWAIYLLDLQQAAKMQRKATKKASAKSS